MAPCLTRLVFGAIFLAFAIFNDASASSLRQKRDTAEERSLLRFCREHCRPKKPTTVIVIIVVIQSSRQDPRCKACPPSFLQLPEPGSLSKSCAQFMAWTAKDNCKSVTERFGVPDFDTFKRLNPHFDEPDCDRSILSKYAGLLFCIREANDGEPIVPLDCNEYHMVSSVLWDRANTCPEQAILYKEALGLDVDFQALNPLTKCDSLIDGEVLCAKRDLSAPLRPQCMGFYPFAWDKSDKDCNSIMNKFDFSQGLGFPELNVGNSCDSYAKGQLLCIAEAKNDDNSGKFYHTSAVHL